MIEATKENLKKLAEYFKGKGGGPESESHVLDNNFDKKKGYVTVWSDTKDVAKIVDRCGTGILRYEIQGDGVQLYIDRKCFRGIHCAFRRPKEK